MSWLSLLLLLICPLSMMFMMRGHHHGNGSLSEAESHVHAKHDVVSGDYQTSESFRKDSNKIKKLEEEVEYLKRQNVILQGKVDELHKN